MVEGGHTGAHGFLELGVVGLNVVELDDVLEKLANKTVSVIRGGKEALDWRLEATTSAGSNL